jgi:MerC mercury resistance protein
MEYSESTYRQSTKLDTAGFIASFICAVHCAFMPLLLAALPLAGISFLDSPLFDAIMVSISFGIASIALLRGYLSYHRKLGAIAVVLLGFGLIAYGHFSDTNYSFLFEAFGALTVAASHVVNHFLTRAALVRKQVIQA